MARGLSFLFAVLTATVAGADHPQSPVLAVSGRFGHAQACAIGPELVLTAAHVHDMRPFDQSVPPYPLRFEASDGTVGILHPIAVDVASDLALSRPSVTLTHFSPLAERAPEVGDELHWEGYDWRKRSNVAALRQFTGRVARIRAGTIWLEKDTPGGSSGSCVQTEKGEVVGIISIGMTTEDLREAAGAVAVFGPWRAEVERLIAKAAPPQP